MKSASMRIALCAVITALCRIPKACADLKIGVLTMAEYIDREATYADFEKCNAENPKWTPSRVNALISRQPAADVAPVVHGRWEVYNTILGLNCICSECGSDSTMEYRFCPYCGCKMDGDG